MSNTMTDLEPILIRQSDPIYFHEENDRLLEKEMVEEQILIM